MSKFLSRSLSMKWALGVYVALIFFCVVSVWTLQQQGEDRRDSGDVQVSYLIYHNDLRAYDNCIINTERTNALSDFLEVLGTEVFSSIGDNREFTDLAAERFPMTDIDEKCGPEPELVPWNGDVEGLEP